MNTRTKNRYAAFVDPFVLNRLHASSGKNLIVQTRKDTLRGNLFDVQPDHIILSHCYGKTTILINQILSILPE
ncbi:DUF2642 domain-containing protein [Alkalihalobacillus sp. R86527]|uniref:DUF2642 domain-containing protein n=1 Tax=Alkalihalobacillus sp. R86527 TaxID=3093863 RepID=UPI00366C1AD9